MFKKASKKDSKLRLALFGVSGSGKTYSALRIASGLGQKIAVIDTERGSASKYSDRFNFDVAECEKPTINNLKMIIDQAKGYDVLVIDSMSHAWIELLQEVEQIAKSRYGGNTWSAWSEGTPKQQGFINSILAFPGHIIATMRVETNWTTMTNEKGKTVPVRVGEAPKQGKGMEYEFDMLMQLSQDHIAQIIKDRTGKYQDELIEKPGEEFGRELAAWLEDDQYRKYAEEETGTPKTPIEEEAKEIKKEVEAIVKLKDPKNPVDLDELEKKVDEDLGKLFTAKVKEAGITAEDWKDFRKTYGISSNPETFQMYLDSAEKLATIVKDFQDMKTC
jgi:AAA domain